MEQPLPGARLTLLAGSALLVVAISCSDLEQDNVPIAQLREELRIVSNESSINTSLTAVAPGSLVLPDGRILTVHTREAVVRVFDSNGRFVTMFGRAGDGPGEFRTPLIAGTVGDSIWVFDGLGRWYYEIFGPDLKPTARIAMPRRVNILHFGLTSQRTTIAVIGFRDTAQAGIYGDTSSAGSSNAAGLLRPIAFQFRQREHRFQVNDPGLAATTSGAAVRSLRSPLQARSDLAMSRDGREVWAVEPGEVWGGNPGQFQLSRVSMTTGQLSAPVTVSLPARRITVAERDSIIDAAALLNPRFESQIRSSVQLPDYYPPFQYANAMGDGLIWIQEPGRSQERIAIDSTGRVLMRIRLPNGLTTFAATRTHVWGTLRDADDLPIILRYAIVTP